MVFAEMLELLLEKKVVGKTRVMVEAAVPFVPDVPVRWIWITVAPVEVVELALLTVSLTTVTFPKGVLTVAVSSCSACSAEPPAPKTTHQHFEQIKIIPNQRCTIAATR